TRAAQQSLPAFAACARKKKRHIAVAFLLLERAVVRSGLLPAIASATAAAAVAAATTTATAAAATRRLRLGLVDLDLTTVERRAVQLLDRGLRFGIARHLDEAEAFALTRLAVADDRNRIDRAAFAERLADALLTGRIRKVADVKFSAHGYLLR